MWVQSLGQEDSLKKEKATHSSIAAWKSPWTEEPGRFQSTELQKVAHCWATEHTGLEISFFPSFQLLCNFVKLFVLDLLWIFYIIHNLLLSSIFCHLWLRYHLKHMAMCENVFGIFWMVLKGVSSHLKLFKLTLISKSLWGLLMIYIYTSYLRLGFPDSIEFLTLDISYYFPLSLPFKYHSQCWVSPWALHCSKMCASYFENTKRYYSIKQHIK